MVYQDLSSSPNLLQQLESAFERVIYHPVNGFRDLIPSDPIPTDKELALTDVMFAVRLPLNLSSISQMPNLKLLQLLISGTSHVTCSPFWSTINEERRQGLVFANGTGLQSGAIAEHVLATTLNLRLGLNQLISESKRMQSWAVEKSLGLRRPELRGSNVGILGYGAIGRECARLFTAFGCHVSACTRSGSPSSLSSFQHPLQGDPNGSLPRTYYSSKDESSFKQFIEQCDVLVVSLPSEKGNYRLIGDNVLGWMKDDAVLVNVGRGDVVHTDVLVDALKAGLVPRDIDDAQANQLRIGAASLDVTDPEPLPQGHELYKLPNAIVTPHCAGLSDRYAERGIRLMLDNVRALEAGDLRGLQNVI
ncbi:hypothetical protein OIO90_006465 [Microbotryomycetes sp. JL221]|nr:hypothetical protein OIO90_006465 [Microbotryomycetes sp. JL221]